MLIATARLKGTKLLSLKDFQLILGYRQLIHYNRDSFRCVNMALILQFELINDIHRIQF